MEKDIKYKESLDNLKELPVKVSYIDRRTGLKSFDFGIFEGVRFLGESPFFSFQKSMVLDGSKKKGNLEKQDFMLIPFSLNGGIKITLFKSEEEMINNYNHDVSQLLKELSKELNKEEGQIYKKYSDNPIGFQYSHRK